MFSYIFPELLEELGLSKKVSHSWIAVFFLAFLSFIGFMIYPIAVFFFSSVFAAIFAGKSINFSLLVFNNLDSFYKGSGGIFLWLTISFLIGGAANLIYSALRERK